MLLVLKIYIMKNLFQNNEISPLVVGAAVAGVLAAGTGLWYYLSRMRTAALNAAHQHEHAQDYLQAMHPGQRKHKSNAGDLPGLVHPQQ